MVARLLNTRLVVARTEQANALLTATVVTWTPSPTATITPTPTDTYTPSATFTPSKTYTPLPTSTPRTIQTSRGTLNIPGSAFMDGRDLEAQPPVTLMTINVWNSSSRSRVVCKVDHAQAVELKDAKFNDGENRYYIEIDAGSCKGWVSEPFVSRQRFAPIGDKIP